MLPHLTRKIFILAFTSPVILNLRTLPAPASISMPFLMLPRPPLHITLQTCWSPSKWTESSLKTRVICFLWLISSTKHWVWSRAAFKYELSEWIMNGTITERWLWARHFAGLQSRAIVFEDSGCLVEQIRFMCMKQLTSCKIPKILIQKSAEIIQRERSMWAKHAKHLWIWKLL